MISFVKKDLLSKASSRELKYSQQLPTGSTIKLKNW